MYVYDYMFVERRTCICLYGVQMELSFRKLNRQIGTILFFDGDYGGPLGEHCRNRLRLRIRTKFICASVRINFNNNIKLRTSFLKFL